MRFTDILARFESVSEESDGGYTATCPAHPDSNPSLRIWRGEDHKVRLHCRTGCSFADVVAGAGLREADMFDAGGPGASVATEPPALVGIRHTAALARYVDTTSAAYGTTNAHSGEDATAYALRRFGLTAELAAELGIGQDFEDLEADLACRSPAFRAFPRLTVPMRDFAGVAHGLQGRDLSGECPGRWVSLRSPKGHAWGKYGLLRGGGGYDAIIVTEGPGDGLTAVVVGYDALIIRGAALAGKPELLEELAAGLKAHGGMVVAAGDNDRAGQRFNRALADGLRPHGITVYALGIPGEGWDLTRWREDHPEGFASVLHEEVRNAQPVELRSEAPPKAEAKPSPEADPVELLRKYKATHGETDTGNAYAFAEWAGGKVRHAHGVGFFVWDGTVWRQDERAVRRLVHELGTALVQADADEDVYRAFLMRYRTDSLIAELESVPEINVTADEFDAARHLISFRNGTVDLRTGELREHDPADMITQCALVDYVADATCPRWLRFLEEIFPGDAALHAYFQVFLGYCITGEIREHAVGVWYGEKGRNGKGATIRTMQSIFGKTLVKEVPFTMFEHVRGREVHTEQMAGLRGARMVVAQEGNPDTAMNTALLKNLSGGDELEMRHLYGKTFNYSPRFTLVLATNHLPEFSAGGAALWARTKSILFGQNFAGRVDPALEPTIQGPEREGIAAWLVRGAVRYYSEGLADPPGVRDAVEFHKDSVDPLRDLVGELFVYDSEAVTKRSEFNRELKNWREDQGDRSAKFGPMAVKRRLLSSGRVEEKQKHGTGWVYAGIRLMSAVDGGGPGVFSKPA